MTNAPESTLLSRPILIVDDEPAALLCSEVTLRYAGIENILTCSDSRLVAGLFEQHNVEAVLLDLNMPHINGVEILQQLNQKYPEVPVIIVTAANEVATAVECMKNGAFDYMVKPVEDSRLVSGVRRAMEVQELRRENCVLRDRMHMDTLQDPEAFAAIVTNNANVRSILKYVEAIAPTNRPVLITGETGVGKELVARAAHNASGRSGPFVAVNVAGVDDLFFADTLFGHIKGAFTGADSNRQGLVEQAARGTLFLDEIGDLSPASQVKLLRLLQEEEYLPLGSDRPKRSSARILVATNRDLPQLQRDGAFRNDLFFRLRTHQVTIPPLRERLDDLPLLVDHFLEQAAQALGKKKPSYPKEIFVLLGTYAFPGNVRELEGMVFEALANHKDHMLSLDPFRKHIHEADVQPLASADASGESLLSTTARFPTIREATDFLVAEALRRAHGNNTVAAQLLGISRPALIKRLRKGDDE